MLFEMKVDHSHLWKTLQDLFSHREEKPKSLRELAPAACPATSLLYLPSLCSSHTSLLQLPQLTSHALSPRPLAWLFPLLRTPSVSSSFVFLKHQLVHLTVNHSDPSHPTKPALAFLSPDYLLLDPASSGF